MKLYATTTSERATKGQGGNWLDIEIMGDNKMVIARIKITSYCPYEYNMDIFPVVYPYPDKRMSSSCLKLDVKGHGYILKRKITKDEEKGKKHDPRTCENSVPCFDCEALEHTSPQIRSEISKLEGKKQKDKKCKDITCVNCDNTMEGLCDNCK